MQEEAAHRERLLLARASLAEEQRGNAARAARREAASERLAAMQVDSSCFNQLRLLPPALPEVFTSQLLRPLRVLSCCLSSWIEEKRTAVLVEVASLATPQCRTQGSWGCAAGPAR